MKQDGTRVTFDNPADFPSDPKQIKMLEPMVNGTLVFPEEYLGKLIQMCQERRGEQKSISFLSAQRVVMVYKLPLNEIVEDFFDQIKGATSGYASFDYDEAGYEQADVVKLSIGLNGDPVDALSSKPSLALLLPLSPSLARTSLHSLVLPHSHLHFQFCDFCLFLFFGGGAVVGGDSSLLWLLP